MQILILGLSMVLSAIAAVLLVLTLMLLLECVAARWPHRVFKPQPDSIEHPRLAVLVPAHNEAVVIRQTLESLVPQLGSQDCLVVVADNCSDATAAIAREAGATVIERFDEYRRGKGYALDYGLQWLASDPPDVVVFVDADCLVYPGAIAQLTAQAIATGRPVQSNYLMEKPPISTPQDDISAFSVVLKNRVRSQGMSNLGLPLLLTGSGMAFPWRVIRSVNLASSNIVEDMKMGLDLAIAGFPASFCDEAQVMGRLPQQADAATRQRTRWIHGHLQSIQIYTPQLVQAALHQRRIDLLATAIDLSILPLTLMVTVWLVLLVLSAALALLSAVLLPLLLVLLAGLCLVTALVIGWSAFGREALPMTTLSHLPTYLLGKLPIFASFLRKPEARWVRTDRDEPGA